MTEMLPEYAGCLWPADPACLSDDWEAMDETVQTRSLALASATLNRLTGHRVTNCPITVRPRGGAEGCFVPTVNPWDTTGSFRPGMNVAGHWVNNCGPACASPHTQVRLPRPVGRIDEVKIDGVVIPPEDYALVDGNLLVYRGAGDGWPLTQDITLPDTEAGTFSVTYLNGYPPDALAAYAVGTLAMEYAKACTGKNCRLPKNVTSIVRQGVAMEIATGSFPNGMTGIREVDAFIALWNPNNQRGSRIFVPGASW